MPVASRDTVEITSCRLLLVEGHEEVRFFEALAKHLGLADRLQVIPAGGRNRMAGTLPSLPKAPNFAAVEALAVVRDAEESEDSTFQSVCGALENAQLPVPGAVLTTASAPHQPRVTVMVLPGGGEAGSLETLCMKALQAQPAWQCVDQFLECLAGRGISHSTTARRGKAAVHAFLASRCQPDRRLGEAAEAGVFDWQNEAFADIRDLLRRLVQ